MDRTALTISVSRMQREPPTSHPMHFCRLVLVGLACAGSAVAFAANAPIKADSAISAVTVYTDRAIVTREAKVELPEGA
jgi:hypothetical protein